MVPAFKLFISILYIASWDSNEETINDCNIYHFVAIHSSNGMILRVNVSKDQSRYKQGSVDLADFHIFCSVFHADSHGAIRFS